MAAGACAAAWSRHARGGGRPSRSSGGIMRVCAESAQRTRVRCSCPRSKGVDAGDRRRPSLGSEGMYGGSRRCRSLGSEGVDASSGRLRKDCMADTRQESRGALLYLKQLEESEGEE